MPTFSYIIYPTLYLLCVCSAEGFIIDALAVPRVNSTWHIVGHWWTEASVEYFRTYTENICVNRGIAENTLECLHLLPKNCKDLLDLGDSGRGVRLVRPFPNRPHEFIPVYCDHTIDGGGWMVFQRRTNAVNSQIFFRTNMTNDESLYCQSNAKHRENFQRTWSEYVTGFGCLDGEFWLGLEMLHALTLTPQELRVDLADYDDTRRWATYRVFNVGPSMDNYRLTVAGYSGNAGDAMLYHNGMRFSTYDVDNDDIIGQYSVVIHDPRPNTVERMIFDLVNSGNRRISGNCAERHRGGWWYRKCHHANPNGYPREGNHAEYGDGINWLPWRGNNYSLKNTTFMIRPNQWF